MGPVIFFSLSVACFVLSTDNLGWIMMRRLGNVSIQLIAIAILLNDF